MNLVGCFAIAVVMQAASALGWPATLRLAVTVGFIGGLTTYSSFNYETIDLVEPGVASTALLYAVTTFAGGLLAGWLGLVVSRPFR